MRSRRARVPVRRVGPACALLLLTFVALAARAVHLSVFDERGSILGERQRLSVLVLPPERGTIFDRNGKELALSIAAPSVYAMPSALVSTDRAASQLAPVLGVSAREIRKRLRGRRSFVFLARWVTPARAARVRKLGIPGIGVLEEPRRTYPHKGLAAHVVGFANIDGRGVRGIEQQEDAWLRGTPLRLPVERDGSGNLLVRGGEPHWSTAGGDVALTLDAAMQADATLALRDAVEKTGARGGIVVSMDPSTGEILALAEAPSFDPNRFREIDYGTTRSRAFLDALEPGSTFKAFLVAAALENGTVSTGDLIDCGDGTFRVPGRTVRDRKPFGPLSAAEILRVSSNIGAVKIAFDLGPRAHFEMLRRFGFGASTNSRFPGESAGVLRGSRGWRPSDHAAIAFGQGVGVTAVQLAAASAALANGGEWLRPRLVAARRAPRAPWQPTTPQALRRVVSAETAASVLAMLEGVTGGDGTGRRAALRGLRVAGKTGTAQKFDVALGRYSETRFVAWFIGIAPARDPRLVVVVALDEPRRPFHTGGVSAAPLFARVAAAQLARLRILTEPERLEARRAPARSRDRKAAPAAPPTPPALDVARIENRVLLPDFRGLSVAEVKQITSSAELPVEISGDGHAISQEPPPGTVMAAHGVRVLVRFEPRAGET